MMNSFVHPWQERLSCFHCNAKNFLGVTVKLVIFTTFALAFSTIWEGEDASLLSMLQVSLLRYLFGCKEIWVEGSLCVEVRREKKVFESEYFIKELCINFTAATLSSCCFTTRAKTNN